LKNNFIKLLRKSFSIKRIKTFCLLFCLIYVHKNKKYTDLITLKLEKYNSKCKNWINAKTIVEQVTKNEWTPAIV
jgi:hypothetical protein